MSILRYNNFLNESKLNLLLEGNMVYKDDFKEILKSVDSPLSKEILDLEGVDVDVDTNFIDISDDKDNFIQFKSDKKSKNSCVIIDFGASLSILSKEIFPSFAKLNEEPSVKRGLVNWWELLQRNQKATIVKEITSTDDFNEEEVKDRLKWYLNQGRKIYHIRFNVNGEKVDFLIEDKGLQIGEKAVSSQEVRVGSFVQSLLKKAGKEVKGPEIEDFVTKFSIATKAKKENVFADFELVEGDDIKKFYYEGNYYRGGSHTLGSSCMRYYRCQDYLNIYSKNPKSVGLIILKSKEDPTKIIGRALLWKKPEYMPWDGGDDEDIIKKYNLVKSTESEGRPFMDRIYVSNSQDQELFIKYAIKMGYVYKKNQNISEEEFMFNGSDSNIGAIIVDLEMNGFSKYPYLDTLCYYEWNSGFLTNERNLVVRSHYYELRETDGGNGEECERCGGDDEVECYNCDGRGNITCEECDGAGEIECGECEGHGTQPCNNCDGSGEEECSSCDGSGEDGEGNECSNCGGSGKMTCTDCDGNCTVDCYRCDGDGTRRCSDCDGDGDIECGECEGSGRLPCPDCQ